MSMRSLLITTAVLETVTGLALLVIPAFLISLLLGSTLGSPSAWLIARLAGAALLTLGVACWLAREDTGSPAARGLLAAMLSYNIAAASLLAYANIGLDLFGIALWPAFVGHIVLAGWCAVCLRQAKDVQITPQNSGYQKTN